MVESLEQPEPTVQEALSKRLWTNRDGATLYGALKDVSGKTVFITVLGKGVMKVPSSKLCERDQELVDLAVEHRQTQLRMQRRAAINNNRRAKQAAGQQQLRGAMEISKSRAGLK